MRCRLPLCAWLCGPAGLALVQRLMTRLLAGLARLVAGLLARLVARLLPRLVARLLMGLWPRHAMEGGAALRTRQGCRGIWSAGNGSRAGTGRCGNRDRARRRDDGHDRRSIGRGHDDVQAGAVAIHRQRGGGPGLGGGSGADGQAGRGQDGEMTHVHG